MVAARCGQNRRSERPLNRQPHHFTHESKYCIKHIQHIPKSQKASTSWQPIDFCNQSIPPTWTDLPVASASPIFCSRASFSFRLCSVFSSGCTGQAGYSIEAMEQLDLPGEQQYQSCSFNELKATSQSQHVTTISRTIIQESYKYSLQDKCHTCITHITTY